MAALPSHAVLDLDAPPPRSHARDGSVPVQYQNVYVPPRPDDSLRVLQRSVQANPFHARSWYYLALRYDKDEKNPEKGKEYGIGSIMRCLSSMSALLMMC